MAKTLDQEELREAHRRAKPLRVAWVDLALESEVEALNLSDGGDDGIDHRQIEIYKHRLLSNLRTKRITAIGQPARLGLRYQIELIPYFLFHPHFVNWNENVIGKGDQKYIDVRITREALSLDSSFKENDNGVVRAPEAQSKTRGRPGAIDGLVELIIELEAAGRFYNKPPKIHWEIVADEAKARALMGLSGRRPVRSTVMKAMAQHRSAKSVKSASSK